MHLSIHLCSLPSLFTCICHATWFHYHFKGGQLAPPQSSPSLTQHMDIKSAATRTVNKELVYHERCNWKGHIRSMHGGQPHAACDSTSERSKVLQKVRQVLKIQKVRDKNCQSWIKGLWSGQNLLIWTFPYIITYPGFYIQENLKDDKQVDDYSADIDDCNDCQKTQSLVKKEATPSSEYF